MPTSKASTERGSTRLVLYLLDISEDEVDELCEEIADIVVRRGLTTDENLGAMLAVEPWEWPESPDETVRQVGKDASRIWLPGADSALEKDES